MDDTDTQRHYGQNLCLDRSSSPCRPLYRKVSLFDLDHTLFKENGSYQFGIYLYRQKIFSFPSVLYYAGCYALHKIGCLSMHNLHERIFNSLFLNKSARQFMQLAEAFLKEKFNSMLYSPAVQKLEEAKRAGHFTAIFSSSPDFLVSLIARRFNVHEWVATSFLQDENNNFSELCEVMEGNVKTHYLHVLSQKLDILPGDFTAYSDSYCDLPFLEAAGTAVGVNPDKKLREICKKNQWQII